MLFFFVNRTLFLVHIELELVDCSNSGWCSGPCVQFGCLQWTLHPSPPQPHHHWHEPCTQDPLNFHPLEMLDSSAEKKRFKKKHCIAMAQRSQDIGSVMGLSFMTPPALITIWAPGGAACIGYKFGHQVALLALTHCLLASSLGIELVSSKPGSYQKRQQHITDSLSESHSDP